MIEQANKIFVVEYSISKDQTRVRSLRLMLEQNLKDIATKSVTDYLPVAMFETRSKAEVFAAEIRHLIDEQDPSIEDSWQHISEPLEKVGNQLLNILNSEPRKK